MLVQVPEFLKGIGYYEGMSLILWIIATVLLFASAILFFIKAMTFDVKETKLGLLAMANFGIFFGLTRIFYLLAVYNPANYITYVVIGYITQQIALFFIIYLIETQAITQTKKIFSIFTLTILVISIITLAGLTTRDFALTLIWIVVPLTAGIVMLLYIYIITQSTGRVRTKATLVFIAIILLFISHMLDSEFFIAATYPLIPLEVTPSIMIAGVILYTYANIFYETT